MLGGVPTFFYQWIAWETGKIGMNDRGGDSARRWTVKSSSGCTLRWRRLSWRSCWGWRKSRSRTMSIVRMWSSGRGRMQRRLHASTARRDEKAVGQGKNYDKKKLSLFLYVEKVVSLQAEDANRPRWVCQSTTVSLVIYHGQFDNRPRSV